MKEAEKHPVLPPSLKCLEAPFCPWPQPWWSQTQSTRSFGSCWHRTDAQLVRKTCGSLFPLLPLSRHNLLIQFPLKNNGFNEGGKQDFPKLRKVLQNNDPPNWQASSPSCSNERLWDISQAFSSYWTCPCLQAALPDPTLGIRWSEALVSVFHWVALLWFEEGLGERREEPG